MVQPFRSEPDSVTLIGPESVLKTMTSIRTKTSNFTAINSNIDKSVELDIAKISNQLTYSHKKVMIRAEVEKFTEGTVSVPVTIVNVPEHLNINFFPKEMMLKFIEMAPDFVRNMFRDLFNENKEVENRISRFQFCCDSLLSEYKSKFPLTIENRHFHLENHMISMYLCFRFPEPVSYTHLTLPTIYSV